MSRIASLAANNQLVSQLLRTRSRIFDLQTQVSSQKKSQTYEGIAKDSRLLVRFENQNNLLDRFVQNNELMDLKLKSMDTVLGGIEKTIRDFRDQLDEYNQFQSGSPDSQDVKNVQDAAFRALKAMQVDLNTDVGGEFLFAGTRVTTAPVDLGLTTLANFQTQFDGTAVVYPHTRDANVETKLTTATATTGNLTFDNTTNTITAANAGTLASIPVGSTITVAGASSGNNGRYTVVSNTGTVITITGAIAGTSITVTNSITNNETVAATLSVGNYYRGDSQAISHSVSKDRSFTMNVNATDPAFEKAIRAMAIVAQGVFGTAGGLDQHPERVDDALYLLNAALDPNPSGTPPFGTEKSSNTEQLARDVGFNRLLINDTNENHRKFIGFLEQRIADFENADPLDAITRMQNDQTVLQASLQTLVRLRELTLTNFL